MRPVNLIPQSQRPKHGGGRPGSAYLIVGVLGALLVAVLVYVLAANQVTSKQDELARVTEATSAAQARAASLGSFGDFASLKQTRESSVAQLAQTRLDWERFMRELARVLPEDVFISALEASAAAPADGGGSGGPSAKLTGCAPSQPSVARLMVRLRRLTRATEVKLTESTRVGGSAGSDGSGGSGGSCGKGYAWSTVVTFDPAPAATPERVPAHLGGGA